MKTKPNELEAHGAHDLRTQKSFRYTPWEGSFFFLYQEKWLFYQATQVDIGHSNKEEQISITCIGRSFSVLKDLLAQCRLKYLKELKSKTTIYGHDEKQWKKEKSVPVRPLSTVILDKAQKNAFIDDVKEFLNPQTRCWYADVAIPYKRGYLFHGPPGTGKSSFSLSIAGALGMDIYVVSIPDTTDLMLKSLFCKLPESCVVLLEDIDAVEATHTGQFFFEHSNYDIQTRPQDRGVTLSGLLNVLDDVGSQEERLLIMTTRHPEKLDEVLTRPGRVDLKVKFQLADRGIARGIYRFMFKKIIKNVTEVSGEKEDTKEIETQADAFAVKIPELEFSPAEIISYLLQHNKSPDVAIRNCSQWVDNLLRVKTKKEALKSGYRDI